MKKDDVTDEIFELIKKQYYSKTSDILQASCGRYIGYWTFETNGVPVDISTMTREIIIDIYLSGEQKDTEREYLNEYEPNYEVNIFLKEPYKYIDCMTCYADDREYARDIAKIHFNSKYSDAVYAYEVEYIGSLESDRDYEMKVDNNIYTDKKNLNTVNIQNLETWIKDEMILINKTPESEEINKLAQEAMDIYNNQIATKETESEALFIMQDLTLAKMKIGFSCE